MDYDIDKVVVLSDDMGNEVEIEYIDSVSFDGKDYAMFMPLENDDDEVIIMQYDNVSDDYDSFIPVTDPEIMQAVYDLLREKYKDELQKLDEITGEEK